MNLMSEFFTAFGWLLVITLGLLLLLMSRWRLIEHVLLRWAGPVLVMCGIGLLIPDIPRYPFLDSALLMTAGLAGMIYVELK